MEAINAKICGPRLLRELDRRKIMEGISDKFKETR